MSVETSSEQRCPVSAGYNPFELSAQDDPYTWLKTQRQEQPVFFSPLAGCWVVTSYADIEFVLKQPEIFSNVNAAVGKYHPAVEARFEGKVPGGATLLGLDRPDHTRLRRVIQAAFTPRRVAAMEEKIRATVVELIDALPSDEPFDLVKDFSYPLALRVITDVVGIPREDIPMCHHYSERWNQLMGAEAGGMPVDEQLARADDTVKYHEYIQDLIRKREREPADDLITAVWEVRRQGDVELDDFEMLSLFPGLLSAGHETTANVIGNGIWHLLKEPGQWQRLVAGEYEIPAVVEEMLRFDSSIFELPRRVVKDTKVGEAEIPAGDLVMLHFGAANHDPAQFQSPDEFRPGREATAHLAFGRGAHFCLGSSLARLEIRLSLEELTTRRPNLHLAGELGHVADFVFRALTELPVAS
jgi:cytochrome P450